MTGEYFRLGIIAKRGAKKKKEEKTLSLSLSAIKKKKFELWMLCGI